MLICTWFTSLSTMPSRFLTQMARRPLGVGVELDNVPLYIYTPHVPYPSIHPSITGHLGCFHVLVLVANAAMNTGVQRAPQDVDLISFVNIPRSGIAPSHSNSIFSFVRNLCAVFHSEWSNEYSIFVDASNNYSYCPQRPGPSTEKPVCLEFHHLLAAQQEAMRNRRRGKRVVLCGMDKNFLFEANLLGKFFPGRLLDLNLEGQWGRAEMPSLWRRALQEPLKK